MNQMDPYAFYSNASDRNGSDTDGSSSKLWGMARRNDSTSGVVPVKNRAASSGAGKLPGARVALVFTWRS